MGLLTIGAFARASRLSPKALRLYDELGLLRPVEVDPASGYRFYDAAQLDRARLVAWLRRLGMPLTRIRIVCDAEAAAAAEEVTAFWAQVVSDVATRQDLSAFLVDYLTGKATAMSDTHASLGIRYGARSDIGRERTNNEDCAYAGPRLLAVADGLGGHQGGDRASETVIKALQELESDDRSGLSTETNALTALNDAVRHAADELRSVAETEPALQGLGTTLTAMLWSGSQLALAHIGDSRAYLMRDGQMFQLTDDHTYVQSLVDAGHISAEEARSHPQRSLLIRAIDAETDPQADLSLHAVQPGDRYLLCTDGLYNVVSAEAIEVTLSAQADPEQTVANLIDLANSAGRPDNVACVVADVVKLAS